MHAKTFLIIYLIVINAAGFLLMGIDKRRAKRLAYRIPEATLFAVSLLLGSAGSFAGMLFFRHKTKHPLFIIGMPLILAVQIAAAIILVQSPLVIQFL